MATPLLVLIILAIVIIASIITSVVTYVILSGRNKRIRLAEQYRQLGITEQYLKIQDEIEDRLAEEIIAGKVKAGDRVVVTTKHKELIVEKD